MVSEVAPEGAPLVAVAVTNAAHAPHFTLKTSEKSTSITIL